VKCECMSADEDRLRARLLEELLDKLLRSRDIRKPRVFFVEGIPERKEERSFDVNEQVLRLSSELESLRSQFNRYMKIETREESASHFKQLVSKISEISEVYTQNTTDGIVFWIFYDKEDRIEVLEKIVDAECELERIFKGLNFEYRVLSQDSINPRIMSQVELLFKR